MSAAAEAAATQCPRCGAGVGLSQEFCLDCGLKLPGRGRVGPLPLEPRRVLVPILLAGIVAVAGAALAIWLTWDEPGPAPIVTAIGGSATIPEQQVATGSKLAQWPRGRNGWTIALVSVPKSAGRDAAVARAQQARRRGLRVVGVLDSSAYASLQPGAWVVFAGVYGSEPEAASGLRRARAASRTARVQRVAG
jgi:hypothetical protein